MSDKRKAVYSPEADKKLYEKNKGHKLYLNYRSTSRSFIRNKATIEDLEELEELIKKEKKNCQRLKLKNN